MSLPIALACGAYDRTQAIADGRVRIEGVELTCLRLPVEEIFYRTARYQEFDVSEMSFASYTMLHDRGGPFIAVPVFPSRAFRHNGIYVNAASGIERPEDLVGKIVGVPEYQVTAAVWIRGMLAEHYGVPVESVRYRTGGIYQPGRVEKVPFSVPGVEIEPIPADRTLDAMLRTGEIDAMYTPRVPPAYAAADPAVKRLWADPKQAEQEYLHKTGIFPIMHTLVIRRDVYERSRWLAGSLMKAFEESKRITLSEATETAALSSSLPWSYAEAEETRRLIGDDWWPYGVEANRHVLGTLLGYLRDQGLVSRLYDAEELFAPEALTTYLT
jgi:4,5-dihydroxyphthalate decarboxylase